MEENTKELESRIYETSYWLISTLDEAKLEESHKTILGFITKNGGEIISEALPEIADISYPMAKIISNKRMWFTTGYFGWVKYEIQSTVVDDIDQEMSKFDPMIRFLTVKTVREDTMASLKKKPVGVKGMKDPVVTDEAVANPSSEIKAEIDIEDLDDKIDDLVSE